MRVRSGHFDGGGALNPAGPEGDGEGTERAKWRVRAPEDRWASVLGLGVPTEGRYYNTEEKIFENHRDTFSRIEEKYTLIERAHSLK